MSEIRPEDWVSRRTIEIERPDCAYRVDRQESGDIVVSYILGSVDDPPEELGRAVIPAGALTAVAALALHGQNVGFTWADVEALEGEARFLRNNQWHGAEELKSIAARIAALLPPREP